MAWQATAVLPRLRTGDDEGRLVRAAAEGDVRAIGALLRRYEDRVFNLALRITGSEHDAAEATREAFLDVLERLPVTPDPERVFGRQLFAAARNAGHGASEGRRRTDGAAGATAARDRDGRGDGAGTPAGWEESPLLDDWRDELRTANARLSARQREALALRELGAFSYREIAQTIEVTPESVPQLIATARIELRDELRGTDLADEPPPSEDCEQAIQLIAMRDDDELPADSEDADWLIQHLVGCHDCRFGLDAMQEARLSYSAWDRVAAPPAVFEETMAAVAALIGRTELTPPAGAMAAPFAAAAAGAGEAGGPGGIRAAPPWRERWRLHPRAVLLAAGWAAALLLGLVALQVSGAFDASEGEHDPPEETLEPPAVTKTPATVKKPAPKKRTKKRDKEPELPSAPQAVVQQPARPAPAPVGPPAAQQPERAAPRRRERRERAERPRTTPPQTAPAPQQQAPAGQEAPAPGGTAPTAPVAPAPPEAPPAGCANPQGQPC